MAAQVGRKSDRQRNNAGEKVAHSVAIRMGKSDQNELRSTLSGCSNQAPRRKGGLARKQIAHPQSGGGRADRLSFGQRVGWRGHWSAKAVRRTPYKATA